MDLFLKGLVSGFIIAVPIGPVALLCFRRVLTDSRPASFVTVLGAATADAIYGLVAAFGLNAVSRLLADHGTAMRVCGGLFLLYLGIMLVRSKSSKDDRKVDAVGSLWSAYFSTLLLMLANPAILVSYIAIFTVLELGGEHMDALVLGTALLLGSTAWWFVYEGISKWIGSERRNGAIRFINLGAGSLISVLGAWKLLEAALEKR